MFYLDGVLANEIAEKAMEHFKAEKPPRVTDWKDMAIEGGFERMHTTLYDFLSILGHGTTFGFTEDDITPDVQCLSNMASAIGLVEAINAVAKNWLLYKSVMSVDQLETILRFD